MTSHSTIGAIVLAAGRSRRMGQFKPLLKFGSSTMIETCLDTIESVEIGQAVVVAGHRGTELRDALSSRNVTWAINSDPDSQMGASIALGVQALVPETDAVFLALADQPAVSARMYTELLAEKERTGAKIVVPEFDGHRGHPVLVDLCYRDELLRLDEGEGLRGFLDRHVADVYRVPVDNPYVLLDLDTPEQYEELVKNCGNSSFKP